jgi:hypothetical protein
MEALGIVRGDVVVGDLGRRLFDTVNRSVLSTSNEAEDGAHVNNA